MLTFNYSLRLRSSSTPSPCASVNLSFLHQVGISPSIGSSHVFWPRRTCSSLPSSRTRLSNLVCALPDHFPTTLTLLTYLPSVDRYLMEDISEYTSDTSSLTGAPLSVMDIDEGLVSLPNSEISPRRGRFGRFGVSSSFIYGKNGDEVEHDEFWNGSAISPKTHRQRNASPRTHFSNLGKLPVEASDLIIGSLRGSSADRCPAS